MKWIKPEAFFIDLDGTAYDAIENGKHAISKTNKKTIMETNKKIPVIISTGRPPQDVYPLLKSLKLKYGVCQNGAIIIDNKNKVIYKKEITNKLGNKIIDFAKSKKLIIKPNATKVFYGVNFFNNIIVKNILKFKTSKKYNFNTKCNYTKFVLAGGTKKNMLKYQIKLKELLGDKASIVTSGRGFTIEITSDKATKGLGNKKIASLLKVSPDKCVHIGDSMNDSTTAEYMKLIAMKDGDPELIKMAHYIGVNHKNAGLSKILLGDIKKIKA